MVEITYIDADGASRTVEGEVGATVMETAIRNGVPGIVAECGGACACATCHVYVGEEWRGGAGGPPPGGGGGGGFAPPPPPPPPPPRPRPPRPRAPALGG